MIVVVGLVAFFARNVVVEMDVHTIPGMGCGSLSPDDAQTGFGCGFLFLDFGFGHAVGFGQTHYHCHHRFHCRYYLRCYGHFWYGRMRNSKMNGNVTSKVLDLEELVELIVTFVSNGHF